jgi:hypothetical protein
MNNFSKTAISALILSVAMSSASHAQDNRALESLGVSGRDLDYDIPILKGFGHVGIYFKFNKNIYFPPGLTENVVLEVVNEQKVVQTNSLENFKSKAKYWGSKQIINDRKIIDSELPANAYLQVMDNGCTEYTFKATFKPTIVKFTDGGMKIIQCGFYRCDTFVSYIFHTFGDDSLSYNEGEAITPAIIWKKINYSSNKSFKYNPESASFKKALEFSEKYEKSFKNKSKLPSINSVTEEELKNMTPEDFMVVVDVKESEIKNKTVKNLLLFSKRKILDSGKRLLLIDTIGFVGTPEMIPELIDMYKSDLNLNEQETLMLKKQILVTIQHISQNHLFNGKHPSELKKLKLFYKDLLNGNPSDKEREISSRGINNFEALEEIKKNGYLKVKTVYPNPLGDIIKESNKP